MQSEMTHPESIVLKQDGKPRASGILDTVSWDVMIRYFRFGLTCGRCVRARHMVLKYHQNLKRRPSLTLL